MTRALIVMGAIVAACASHANAQTCAGPDKRVSIVQRTYLELESLVPSGLLFLWVPDIKGGFFSGPVQAFDIWVVEGIYGRPFPKKSDSFSDSRFERLRTSQNVIAKAIRVDPRSLPATTSFQYGRNKTVMLRIEKVFTPWAGDDSVTVTVCELGTSEGVLAPSGAVDSPARR